MFDTIIIGSGPSGVSAALYLKRAGKNVLVLTTNKSNLLKAEKIENYYGMRSISGKELYDQGIEQLRFLGIPLYEEEVVSINWNTSFTIKTNKNSYEGKTVIIATGVNRNNSKISNVDTFEGRGISYCATCDGFFYKNKKVGVIGNSNLALHEIEYLREITKDITVFTNGEESIKELDDLNLPIIRDKITSFEGTNRLEKVIINEKEIIIDGIFIATGTASGSIFAKTLGLETNNNYLVVDENYKTNIDGLYAIGDILGKNMQVNKAVSDGYIVSKSITNYLKESEVK